MSLCSETGKRCKSKFSALTSLAKTKGFREGGMVGIICNHAHTISNFNCQTNISFDQICSFVYIFFYFCLILLFLSLFCFNNCFHVSLNTHCYFLFFCDCLLFIIVSVSFNCSVLFSIFCLLILFHL